MKKKAFYYLASMLLLSMMLVSCDCKDETHSYSSTNIQDIGGAGNFKAINMSTNDTLYVDGALSIYINGLPELNASNGNIIKLMFEQAEKYNNYKFNTTYTLHDSTEVDNQYQYEYVISNTKPGKFKVSMSAKYVQKDESHNINISGGGNFILNIIK